MSDDDASDGIASLTLRFRRFCQTQPNEGGRLSRAKTSFDEAMYWLRINDDKHRERKMGDERGGQQIGELTHG
jgi:hypothetical protein